MMAHHLFIVWMGYIDNKDRKRMEALQALTGDRYRQDIISNNIGEWIINGQYPILLLKMPLSSLFVRIRYRIQTPWEVVCQ
jgi:hypothetical protein